MKTFGGYRCKIIVINTNILFSFSYFVLGIELILVRAVYFLDYFPLYKDVQLY